MVVGKKFLKIISRHKCYILSSNLCIRDCFMKLTRRLKTLIYQKPASLLAHPQRLAAPSAPLNDVKWNYTTTYQLILIGSDCSENGFWENEGSVALLLNVGNGMVDPLGPDD